MHMIDYRNLEKHLLKFLDLSWPPIAIAFRDDYPSGVAKFSGTEPSGCSFWKLAAEGQTFYTVPSDHYNCPIGSYTHNIPLPEDRNMELDQTLSQMSDIGYIRMEEIPGIHQLAKTPGIILYAPLKETPIDPDIVLFAGKPGRLMLLQETALRAGVKLGGPLLGRPTCMALPATLTQGAIASTGCIGNRIYTDLEDDNLYVTIPGKNLPEIANGIEVVSTANDKLSLYHLERKKSLGAPNIPK